MNLSRKKIGISIGGLIGYFALKSHSQNSFFSSSKIKEPIDTYLWGNGVYQARPDQKISFDNFEPKKINNFAGENTIKMISFHEYFSAALTVKDKLIFWKSHELPSSHTFSVNDHERKFEILYDKPLKYIAFTKVYL